MTTRSGSSRPDLDTGQCKRKINPPSAADVETVFRRIPDKHRLALLWLERSGARVSSIDHVFVGDYDESRRRVRLRAATTKTRRALWVELHPVLAEAIEASLPHRRFRPGGAPVCRLARRRGPDRDREGLQGGGCPALVAPRLAPPQNLAAPPARRSLGPHRRVRRPA
jgi:integrase